MTRPVDGIDFSHWNTWDGRTTWRLMAHKATEGVSWVDPKFVDRRRRMRTLGVSIRPAYHWLRPDSPVSKQWRHYVSVMGDLLPGEIVMLDWERTKRPGANDESEASYQRWLTVAEIEEWMSLCEHKWPGRCIVYTGSWVRGFDEWRSRHPDFPLWYSNFSKELGPVKAREFGAVVHQWTDNKRVDGFAAPVDANEVLDWRVLERLAGIEATEEQDMAERVWARADGEDHVFEHVGAGWEWVSPHVAAVYDVVWPDWRAQVKVVQAGTFDAFKGQAP